VNFILRGVFTSRGSTHPQATSIVPELNVVVEVRWLHGVANEQGGFIFPWGKWGGVPVNPMHSRAGRRDVNLKHQLIVVIELVIGVSGNGRASIELIRLTGNLAFWPDDARGRHGERFTAREFLQLRAGDRDWNSGYRRSRALEGHGTPPIPPRIPPLRRVGVKLHNTRADEQAKSNSQHHILHSDPILSQIGLRQQVPWINAPACSNHPEYI